jgi:enoyl-CoA hydratase/carnithine racemase
VTVLVERLPDEPIAVVTLNRPEARNAMNTELAKALVGVFGQVGSDRQVRAVVLTGSGDRAFCAGADLKERRGMTGVEWRAQHEVFEAAFKGIRACGKPVVCAANGVAAGGGLEIALAADFIVASPNARFGFPETRVGLIPGGGGPKLLPLFVPLGLARQMLLTGELIDAERALAAGLVNAVHPLESLVDAAIEIARAIAAGSPAAVRGARLALEEGLALGTEAGIENALRHYDPLVDHPDRYEGVEAFNERRPPQFQDPR